MTQRMDAEKLAPAAYQAMIDLERAIRRGPLPKPLFELVKLRASQINGCAYCVDLHSFDARAGGESDERLFAVAVWPEAPFFTEAERAALALTESATRLSEGGDRVPDEVWARAASISTRRPWPRSSWPSPRSTRGTGSASRPGWSRSRLAGTGNRRRDVGTAAGTWVGDVSSGCSSPVTGDEREAALAPGPVTGHGPRARSGRGP